nr:squalene synthase-like [Ipomoea trifida]
MESVWAMLKHPEDVYPVIKLTMAVRRVKKHIPAAQPHWRFCYTILSKVSKSFTLAIMLLPNELREAVSYVFYPQHWYLVRDYNEFAFAEDDMSIATEVKVPILKDFHRHIYDSKWSFSCGTNAYKVLMDQFHHVSIAFLELEKNYQEAIEDIAMRMGRGMAKFIRKEVETLDDYDEYCHYVAGLVGLGLSKIFHISCKEDLVSNSLWNSVGLFLQELKYEENSVKAVECLNEMVTNALSHVEDCLAYMCAFRDPSVLRFYAIPQACDVSSF